MDLPRDFALDVWLRRVGALKNPAVPAYLEADLRLAWQITGRLELSVDGRNLLHERHLEFVNTSITPSEIPRSFMLAARWMP
jgi:iron complex outermembrane recepter protein